MVIKIGRKIILQLRLRPKSSGAILSTLNQAVRDIKSDKVAQICH